MLAIWSLKHYPVTALFLGEGVIDGTYDGIPPCPGGRIRRRIHRLPHTCRLYGSNGLHPYRHKRLRGMRGHNNLINRLPRAMSASVILNTVLHIYSPESILQFIKIFKSNPLPYTTLSTPIFRRQDSPGGRIRNPDSPSIHPHPSCAVSLSCICRG